MKHSLLHWILLIQSGSVLFHMQLKSSLEQRGKVLSNEWEFPVVKFSLGKDTLSVTPQKVQKQQCN